MKKNTMMRIASVLLVVVLLTTSVISGTFAKYVTSDKGSDFARVAKWGVKVEAESFGMFEADYKTDDTSATFSGDYSVSSAGTVDRDDVLAPGTEGSFADIKITGTPEVAVDVGIAATVAATYWLLMFFGRLAGAALGAKVSAKAMLTSVSVLGLVLVLSAMFLGTENTVNLPVFKGTEGFGFAEVPVNAALLVLCGLCTSVMWGGIFNLAVEGLGKYTEKASGIFMALVCGGGILPLLQNAIVDWTGGAGYLTSYWVIVAGLAYLLFYALVGSKNVNKDIVTE